MPKYRVLLSFTQYSNAEIIVEAESPGHAQNIAENAEDIDWIPNAGEINTISCEPIL